MLKTSHLFVFIVTWSLFSQTYANGLNKCMDKYYKQSRDADSKKAPPEEIYDEEFRDFYRNLSLWENFLRLNPIYKNPAKLDEQQRLVMKQQFFAYKQSRQSSINSGFYDPYLYDYVLNHCHYKRRTNKMQKRFKSFDNNLGLIKKNLPLNLKEKLIKTGFARGLGSILRSKQLLGRRDGVWVLRKGIRFAWPVSLNPLSKLKKKIDIPFEMAEWLQIDKDPNYCGKLNGEKDHRKIMRGTFRGKSKKKLPFLGALLLRGGGQKACRLEKDETINGKTVRALLMEYWKITIEDYFRIPGFFEVEVTILNRIDKPNRLDRRLVKKFKDSFWRVGFTRLNDKRAMAFKTTPFSRNIYTAEGPHVIAHEFGHSLSFIDEYSEKKGTKICDKKHIMCSSSAYTSLKNSLYAFQKFDIVYYWNIIRSYPFGEKIKSAKRFNRARSDVAEKEKNMEIINVPICKQYADAMTLEGMTNKQHRSLCMGIYNEKCITNSISNTQKACGVLKKVSSEAFKMCPYCSAWDKSLPLQEIEINTEILSRESTPLRTQGEIEPVAGVEPLATPLQTNPVHNGREYNYEYGDIHPSHHNLFNIHRNRLRLILLR